MTEETRMDIALILSPFAGEFKYTHIDYAKKALKDSLMRGEAPFASHLLYPQVLDDDNPQSRALGLECEKRWIDAALQFAANASNDGSPTKVIIAVYYDQGVSPGMREEISYAFGHQFSAFAVLDWRSLEPAKPPVLMVVT